MNVVRQPEMYSFVSCSNNKSSKLKVEAYLLLIITPNCAENDKKALCESLK